MTHSRPEVKNLSNMLILRDFYKTETSVFIQIKYGFITGLHGPPFIPGSDSADKIGGRMNMFILDIIYLFLYLKLHFCCIFVLWI